MNLETIRILTHELNEARKYLSGVESHRAKLRTLVQNGSVNFPVSISVGSFSVDLTDGDAKSHTYGQHYKISRGREMIALGAIKVADAAVDKAADEVASLENRLRAAVGGA